MTQEQMKSVLEIGVKLSSERDLDRLLEEIVSCVMDLARCDGGTLYLLDGNYLRFQTSRNRSLKQYPDRDKIPPVPLNRESACGLSFLEDRTIRIDDVYHSAEYSFSGPMKYDAQNHYHTQSMLVVPMRSRSSEKLGVLQLINAMDEDGQICPFSPDMALVLESVASQAALAIQNVRYIRQIKQLFSAFVRVMSTAIDERARYNAEHSRRMAQCGEKFIGWLNTQAALRGEEAPFSPDHRDELIMSIWLHDIGKVTTPLEVMDKAKRLTPLQEEQLKGRLRDIFLLGRISALEGRIGAEELEDLRRSLEDAAQRIDAINGAEFIKDEQLVWLDALKQRVYTDADGSRKSWITEEEYEMLSIRRGTLSPAEMEKMHKHVVMTDKLLSQISFSPELAHVPMWAPAHHEKLNGKGYPKGLTAENIPHEVRIMTILDIFDALVASDRPYKRAKTVEEAIRILGFGVKDGELDPELTRQFIESRCWEDFYPSRAEGEA